jgi:hypothetical protein
MKKKAFVFSGNQKRPELGLRCTARGEEIAASQPARARRMCLGTFFVLVKIPMEQKQPEQMTNDCVSRGKMIK